MDYEKKYNEALERARALWQEAIEKEYANDYIKDYETIFPELRESEDERIRRELIEYLRGDLDDITTDDTDRWIAYLEKQKEQKPIQTENEREYVKTLKGLVSDFIRNSGGGIVDTAYYQQIYDWLDGRNVEQNPAWSEEDERRIDAICELLENTSAIHPNYSHRKLIIWLKSLRPSWKPSEEQMEAFRKYIEDFQARAEAAV